MSSNLRKNHFFFPRVDYVSQKKVDLLWNPEPAYEFLLQILGLMQILCLGCGDVAVVSGLGKVKEIFGVLERKFNQPTPSV